MYYFLFYYKYSKYLEIKPHIKNIIKLLDLNLSYNINLCVYNKIYFILIKV